LCNGTACVAVVILAFGCEQDADANVEAVQHHVGKYGEGD
jgi:hypothetical protein